MANQSERVPEGQLLSPADFGLGAVSEKVWKALEKAQHYAYNLAKTTSEALQAQPQAVVDGDSLLTDEELHNIVRGTSMANYHPEAMQIILEQQDTKTRQHSQRQKQRLSHDAR